MLNPTRSRKRVSHMTPIVGRFEFKESDMTTEKRLVTAVYRADVRFPPKFLLNMLLMGGEYFICLLRWLLSLGYLKAY